MNNNNNNLIAIIDNRVCIQVNDNKQATLYIAYAVIPLQLSSQHYRT